MALSLVSFIISYFYHFASGLVSPERFTETEPGSLRAGWWATEPDVGRVAHGVASRVDRLSALGNGQVPLCAALAWRTLF